MRGVRGIVKIAVLLALGFAFFVAYTRPLPHLQAILASATGEPAWVVLVAAIAAPAILSVACAAAFALPLALIYGRRAPWAAGVCIAPIAMVTSVIAAYRPPVLMFVALLLVLFLIVAAPWAAYQANRGLERVRGTRSAP
jgi:hypothetical protein